ncbi:hypothetical protein S7711_10349 [Stachybotrys chartarum IBT 7711]|uniref:Uncharacterized protein n=1 Tax=Stachybotrys chartarum (strain CBS 109288 / IBT 7711) TaxID=1280523 RepID=A0A084B3S5_STACB|nr:hypothetical protein S7711_10349 [Stachybotrys chartarum IBT 7711]
MTSNALVLPPPTPELPVSTARQARLKQALDVSLLNLLGEVDWLADAMDMEVNEHIPMGQTVTDLKRHKCNEGGVFSQLMTISKEALYSIIRGTVAHDAQVSNGSGWHEIPTFEHIQGVYVISLFCEGHGGKFLNCEELEQLVEGLRQYILGAQIIELGGAVTPQEKAAEKWARKVDAVGGNLNKDPRQAVFHAKSNEKSIQALLSMLEARLTTMQKVDPSKKVRMHQSPLYVGYSVNLKTGLQACQKDLHSLNKPLALTASILTAQGVNVGLDRRIASIAMEEGHLPLAERLVVALAGSFVYQTGFKVAEPGANVSAGKFDEELVALYVGQATVLRANMAEVQKHVDERKATFLLLAKLEVSLHLLQKRYDTCWESVLKLQSLAREPSFVKMARLEASREAIRKRLLETATQYASLAIMYPDVYDQIHEERKARGERELQASETTESDVD